MIEIHKIHILDWWKHL